MFTIACVRCQAQLTAHPGFPSVGCPHCGNVNAVPMMAQPMMFVAPTAMMQPKCSRTAYVLLGLLHVETDQHPEATCLTDLTGSCTIVFGVPAYTIGTSATAWVTKEPNCTAATTNDAATYTVSGHF